MKQLLLLVWGLVLVLIAIPGTLATYASDDPVIQEGGSDENDQVDGPGLTPFVENKGQWNPEILFVAKTSYGSLGLFRNGFCHYVRINDSYSPIMLTFQGSLGTVPVGSDAVPTRFNYIYGKDPSAWVQGCKGYETVTYEEVWPGIDLVFRNDGDKTKYELVLRYGSDPSVIDIAVSSGGSLSPCGEGIRFMGPGGGVVFDSPPVTYYQDGEGRIDSDFRIEGNSYGFDLAPYREDTTIIIDPEVTKGSLNYSTYIGGSGDDSIKDMDIDPSGNVFLCGGSSSANFPTTPGSYQTMIRGNTDCVVSKMDKEGRSLIYSTYIGDTSWDRGYAISVLDSGECYVTGQTDSADFPITLNAYQSTLKSGSWDIFLLKLDRTGSNLLASTFIGGSDIDSVYSMDAGPDGSVFIGGDTSSADFPITSDAYQRSITPGMYTSDMVFLQMNLEDMTLLYSTYLGGSGFEVVDDMKYFDGHLYMSGMTDSPDFNVTQGAYQTVAGWNDAILIKFDLGSKTFDFSTFFNGNGWTEIFGIEVDDLGRIYCCGQTSSTNLPSMPDSFDGSFNGGWNDAFVMCMDSTGSRLLHSTYIGGSSEDRLNRIDMDSEGYLHASGWTTSSDFPAKHLAFQTVYGGGSGDGVYLKIDSNCSIVPYSTLIGGNGDDTSFGIDVDVDNEPIIGLMTTSSDLPTTSGCYKPRYSGSSDAYILKLNLTLPPNTPVDVTIKEGDSFVNLSWNSPPGLQKTPITDHEVWRGPTQTTLEFLGRASIDRSYNDTTVMNGQVYWYGVKAVNRIGPGDISVVVKARPGAVPGPPQNIKAEHGNEAVNITWSAPKKDGGFPINSYQIHKLSNGTVLNDPIAVRSDVKRYTDREVVNGMTYRYRITAINERGGSLPSSEVNATPMTKPGKMHLSLESGPSYVNLSWEPPAGNGGGEITAYLLYRGDQYKSLAKYKTLSDQELFFNDTDLQNGLLYRYRIAPVNKEGAGPMSEIVEATPVAVPSAPRNFIVEGGDDFIELTWEPPSDNGGSSLVSYEVCRSQDRSTWALLTSILPTEFSYTDSSVENGRSYVYRLYARNSIGESPFVESNATPMGVPDKVRNLSVEAGDGSVLVAWDDPQTNGGSPIINFEIFRGERGKSTILIITVADGIFEYRDGSVKNGMTYTFSVRATNIIGAGPLTQSLNVKPGGLPTPPTGVMAESGDGSVSIKWNPPSYDGGMGIKEVRIYLINVNNSMKLVYTTELTTGTYRHLVPNGGTYLYVLTSVNELGESGPSVAIKGRPSGKPSQPLSLIAKISGAKVILTWQAPLDDGGTNVTTYKVYRTKASEQETLIAEVAADLTTFTDHDVGPGTNYRYRIAALNINGEGPTTDYLNVKISEDAEMSPLLFIGALFVVLVLIGFPLGLFLLFRRKKADKSVQPLPQFPSSFIPYVSPQDQKVNFPTPVRNPLPLNSPEATSRICAQDDPSTTNPAPDASLNLYRPDTTPQPIIPSS